MFKGSLMMLLQTRARRDMVRSGVPKPKSMIDTGCVQDASPRGSSEENSGLISKLQLSGRQQWVPGDARAKTKGREDNTRTKQNKVRSQSRGLGEDETSALRAGWLCCSCDGRRTPHNAGWTRPANGRRATGNGA
jgi:hypothetical protein